MSDEELVSAGVLFLDILGVSAGACGDERVDYLKRLRDALSYARETASGLEDQRLHTRALFSDSLIAAFPLVGDLTPAETMQPAQVMAARLQMAMIERGFFMRGSLAFGEHYMDEKFAFGPALVEAAGLERRAVMPRVILSKSAVSAERQRLEHRGEARDSPYLLRDDDVTFISYLDVILDGCDEQDGYAHLTRHRHEVYNKLSDHNGQASIEAKYLWVARYHNFVCNRRIPESVKSEHLITLDGLQGGLDGFDIEVLSDGD